MESNDTNDYPEYTTVATPRKGCQEDFLQKKW